MARPGGDVGSPGGAGVHRRAQRRSAPALCVVLEEVLDLEPVHPSPGEVGGGDPGVLTCHSLIGEAFCGCRRDADKTGPHESSNLCRCATRTGRPDYSTATPGASKGT